MMAHYASGTWAIFDEDVESHMGTVGAQYMSYDRYDKLSKKDKGAFGSTYIIAGAALKTSDLAGFANARMDLFGPQLADFMKSARRGITRLTAFGEEMPNIENRIEIADGKDEFGMPLARIVHSFAPEAVALWNANFQEGLAAAKAAGAKEFWSARGNMPTIHLFGGTIMGTDAGNSIANSYGQTHEIANLWIAGPGLFPTEGASNPTYTIFAVAQRGVEQLVAKWGSVAG
jgi:choline dehydrogenase-like flavoprotein